MADYIKDALADAQQVEIYDPLDFPTQRRLLETQVLNAVKKRFPLANEKYIIEVADLGYEKKSEFTPKEQKDALLEGKTLARKLRGSLVLKDAVTGQVLSSTGNMVLMNVPWMTERGTFIRSGHESLVASMFRLEPGVYTRRKNNGVYEAHFNAQQGTGSMFKMEMDPNSGIFYLKKDNRQIKLYPLMKHLGWTDWQLEQVWGPDLLLQNKGGTAVASKRVTPTGTISTMPKIAEEVEPAPVDKWDALIADLEKVRFNPKVTARTLGKPYEALTPDMLADTSVKLLKLSQGAAEPDDRDSLGFQRIYGIPELFSERIVRDSGGLLRKLLWKITRNGKLDSIHSGFLDRHADSIFNESKLGSYIEGSSPVEALSGNLRVTRLGVGGISSTDSVPEESRDVYASYVGFIDPTKTPESLRVGLDMFLTHGVKKGTDGLLYTIMVDNKTGARKLVDSWTAASSTVGLPEYFNSKDKYVMAKTPKGRIELVERAKVDYFLPSAVQISTLGINAIPVLGGANNLRLNMGGRYMEQAVPIRGRQAPLVTLDLEDTAYDVALGNKLGIVKAAKAGVVVNVTSDNMELLYDGGERVTVPLYNNFPSNQKGYLRSIPNFKPGDRFESNAVLAHSNYTDPKGHAALGVNLRTAIMPWKGYNYEDAIVISESAARKLASENMYHITRDVGDGVEVGKDLYQSHFVGRFTADQFKKLGADGVAKPGVVLYKGDPVVAAIKITEPSPLTLGRRLVTDAAEVWEHDFPAMVADSKVAGGRAVVFARADVPMQVGDKIVNLYGNKGVLGAIVKDSEMPVDKAGNPFEVILNPLGVVSRGNPGQIIELQLGKVANKTGKRYVLKPFDRKDMLQFAAEELAKYGMSDVEDVIMPANGKVMPEVMTGVGYFLKLKHMAELKQGARSTGAYSLEDQPLPGGYDGGKRLGLLETSALVGHGAYEILKDAKLVRGQRNDEFWRDFKAGKIPKTPGVPLVNQKFFAHLRGAGIRLDNTMSGVNIAPARKADIDNLVGSREVQNSGTFRGSDFTAIEGGFFDPKIFGVDGAEWGYIKLPEPMINPITEVTVRRLLGITAGEFEKIIAGEAEFKGKTGWEAVRQALASFDLQGEMLKSKEKLKTMSGSKRDAELKRFRAMAAMEERGDKPADYIVDKIPVMPPKFRPIFNVNNMVMSADVNYLYKNSMNLIKDYEDAEGVLPEAERVKAKARIYSSFKTVTGLMDPDDIKLSSKGVGGLLQWVFGQGSAKYGGLQRKLIGSYLDTAGRAVIAPDPKLRMDEVGLPEEMAWELYAPFIIRNMVLKGYSPLTATKEVADRTAGAKQSLMDVMAERPVLVNRAPTLHKFGIMAANPVLVQGDVVKISPLVVAPYNADFDGDQQINSIYINLLDKYRDEYYIKFLGYKPEWFEQRQLRAVSEVLPYVAGGHYYIVNLEDFPFNPGKLRGVKGHISFYEAEKFIKVVVYDERAKQLVLASVDGWSEHKDREVWIVDLSNGRQIITDNDPRAVYGIKQGTLEFVRSAPAEAVGMLVPFARDISAIEIRDPITAVKGIGKMRDILPLDKQTGYVVGALAGSGGVRLRQVGVHPAVVNQYCRFAAQFFTEDSAHSEQWILSNADIVEWAAGRGRHLPPFWFAAPREFKFGLISGLLDIGGIVAAGSQFAINVSSISLRMLQEVQHLLFTLGVASRISCSKQISDCWVLTISIADIQQIKGELNLVREEILKALDIAAPVYIRDDLVPITPDIVEQLIAQVCCKTDPTLYAALRNGAKDGYISRDLVKCAIHRHGRAGLPVEWLSIVDNEAVSWCYVKSFENTGCKETGYDLTVAGYETFMSVDGIILSNTMQIHVPVSQAAVEEARRMMHSKNLRSVGDKSIHYKPIREFSFGLYLAGRAPKDKPQVKYASAATAVRDFNLGKLDVDTPIEIE